jgi:hypothetical protein
MNAFPYMTKQHRTTGKEPRKGDKIEHKEARGKGKIHSNKHTSITTIA